MTKKLLSLLSILTLCMTVSASSNAQEARSGSDLRDIDPGLAKQIARDKQLLEIWKDHVRSLTRERDEAYQRIEELKSNQTADLPAPIQNTAAFEAALRDKEAAFRESEALRSQVASLETQISKLQVQGANQQFAVEVRPDSPAQNPASQKFYADLTKNYMLQQGSIKKLKAELARAESEKSEISREQFLQIQTENESLQRSYDQAIGRVQVLEAETQELAANSKELEKLLAQVSAEKARLTESFERAKGFEGRVAGLESEKEALEKDLRQALGEIQEFESRTQRAESELQKTNANNRALQELIEKIKAETNQLRDQKAVSDQALQDLNLRLQDQSARSKELEASLRSTLAQAEESARKSEEIREDLAAQNDALKEKLRSNAADVQNLKENFETMLEPLISSFEDRK